jgi:ABC-type nitrate/sulfonate/bicarbonate transport system substrate-binding protein
MIPIKTRFLLLGLMLFAVVVVTACVSQIPSDSSVPTTPVLTTVKVAYLPVVSNGPLFIAKEEGYFAKQGINVEFEKFPTVAAALPVLISGDIAVSGGPLTPGLINAVAKGAHVRIVADKGRIAPGYCNSTALMVRKDLFDQGIVRNVYDLKGRKIMGSSDQSYGVFRALSLGNMTTDDVEIIEMDYPSGVIAFKNGAIDAGVLTEPYITQILNSNSAVVLLPAQDFFPDYLYPLYYGPAFLDKDPELGRQFMVAYLQGVHQYNAGKTERNIEILQNYTHLDRDLLKQSCWLKVEETGFVPEQPVIEYMDWMYTNDKITQKVDENQLFDMSYVTYANGVLRNSTVGKTP